LQVTAPAAVAKVSLNLAPTITSGYEPDVVMFWNATKVMTMEINDLEKDSVKVNLEFGSLSIFCSFTSSDAKITITCGPLLS
jgi:spore coat protein U-like protein